VGKGEGWSRSNTKYLKKREREEDVKIGPGGKNDPGGCEADGGEGPEEHQGDRGGSAKTIKQCWIVLNATGGIGTNRGGKKEDARGKSRSGNRHVRLKSVKWEVGGGFVRCPGIFWEGCRCFW